MVYRFSPRIMLSTSYELVIYVLEDISYKGKGLEAIGCDDENHNDENDDDA